MAKKMFANPRDYAMKLSQLVQTTEESGSNVAEYFEKIRTAIDEDQVAEMPKAEFAEISVEFDDVVEVYKKAADDLDQMKAPVRLIGVHGSLKKTFRDYYDATVAMANALDVNKQQVDVTAFDQSEQDQDQLMEEFMKQVRRAFQMVM
ncbi:hypothetical protein PAF15_06245 [Weissella koreensis]|uniref:Uncharacterized protein n=1 Tax=Weissella koreensis TaxID=165096 RepID=A0A7H1MMK8_9LACO|nr:hypothetical protein [Weissella koreensis]AVH75492.1 hypothetical protein C4597_05510 [Weissella koreensis]EJF34471.1 hypothetical protein JC2156_13110 [Weissella koreensis KCTC 3621]MCZ9311543.1 hypothetical protein [Weissella koreensis]QGN20715.1 hypothetical protein GKC51_05490 [Weissella koreensis]QNT64694.1 hypothetical protein FY536_05220 [Weissella koreensis]